MYCTVHHSGRKHIRVFKVDMEKNLWIDYAESRGGSIIDLCMRLEGCTLSEAICLGTERFREYSAQLQFSKERNSYLSKAKRNGKRDKETDKHVRHLATAPAGISHKGTLH